MSWADKPPTAEELGSSDWTKEPPTEDEIRPLNPNAKEEIYLNEQPKDVSLWDRFKIQNLNNDPNEAVNYLRNKYPQYKEGIQYDPKTSEITFSDPETGRVMPLNPNMSLKNEFTHPAELAKDIAGNVVPVTQGLASRAAGGLAGLGAAAASVMAGQPELAPIAARTGYVGGEASTNAALEALKQKLGVWAGINKEVKPQDVINAGVGGAADALLFGGSGASPNEIFKYTGASPAVNEAVQKANEGLITKAVPAVYSAISGIPKRVVETGQRNMGKIKELEAIDDPATQLGGMVQNDISKVEAHQNKIGQKISGALSAHDQPISLQGAMEPWQRRINELEAIKEKEGLSGTQENLLKDLKSKFKDIFGTSSESSVPTEVVDPITLQKSTVMQPSKGTTFPTYVSPSKAFQTKQDLKAAANLPLLLKGGETTEAERLAAQSGGALSSQMENEVKGLSDLNPEYESVSRLLDSIGDKTTNTREKAYNFIRNIGAKNKAVTAEDIMKADKNLGTNLGKTADLTTAFNTFRKGESLPFQTREVLTKAPLAIGGGIGGYYAGNELGGNRGSGAIGAGLGTLAGGTLGSRKAVRGYINLGNFASKFTPYTEQATLPIWNMLMSNHEKQRKGE